MRYLYFCYVYIFFILSLMTTSWARAQSLRPLEGEKLILEQLETAIGQEYKIDFTWSTHGEAGNDQDKSIKIQQQKTPSPKPVPQKKDGTKPIVKKMTRGESKVSQLLRKQREKIKKMRELQKAKYRDDVANQKSGISEKNWIKRKSQHSADWIKKSIDKQNEWVKKKQEVLNRWAIEKLHFKKELPKLKEDLVNLAGIQKENLGPSKTRTKFSNSGFLSSKLKKHEKRDSGLGDSLGVSIISEEFELPIRSQGRRSTCAAFAAVRSMEILAQRKGHAIDLSEQYFYYASKPRCQSSPCSNKGSWPVPAFKFEIPLEKGCPYSSVEENHNETQIPLKLGCRNGRVKVSRYESIKRRHELQEAIRLGYPVVGGFKLNEAFYDNRGYVFLDAHNSAQGLDKHAAGHALLLIGVLDLPRQLWASQGKHCTLVANSWGEGWGLGGRACLSDRWFDRFRYPFDFLVLEDISFR